MTTIKQDQAGLHTYYLGLYYYREMEISFRLVEPLNRRRHGSIRYGSNQSTTAMGRTDID